jgi:dTDP-4-amino-4,6-dideoxygalactose transaminase
MAELASMVHVPFYDLRPSHEPLKDRLLAEIGALVDSNAYTNGPHVAAFEHAWADYCGVEHCVGVASGLDALRLALIAAGIERGDEVIVPANTFIATFEAVSEIGATPVPVDITFDDYNIDPDAASSAITRRTRYLIPVDLYGQLCDAKAIRRVAADAGIEVIEDAAQAHGATRDGIAAGSIGRAAAFSFYPAKNLGAFGDAGALVTSDGTLADAVRALREHGQRAKYRHELEGFTARLDTIQALVLLHKLELLDEWNEQRRSIASAYDVGLADVGELVLPPRPNGSDPVWHLYVVRTGDPDALAEFLAQRGIGTGRHYPEPPHLSSAYSWLGYKEGAFPVAETVCRQGLSLPMFPGLSERQVEAVVESVRDFFAGG